MLKQIQNDKPDQSSNRPITLGILVAFKIFVFTAVPGNSGTLQSHIHAETYAAYLSEVRNGRHHQNQQWPIHPMEYTP